MIIIIIIIIIIIMIIITIQLFSTIAGVGSFRYHDRKFRDWA